VTTLHNSRERLGGIPPNGLLKLHEAHYANLEVQTNIGMAFRAEELNGVLREFPNLSSTGTPDIITIYLSFDILARTLIGHLGALYDQKE